MLREEIFHNSRIVYQNIDLQILTIVTIISGEGRKLTAYLITEVLE